MVGREATSFGRAWPCTLDSISMVRMELLPFIASAAAIAVVAVVAWLVYRYLAELMLIRCGKITRGRVVGAVELGNGHFGKMFVVSYEFSITSSGGNALMYRGRQLMTYGFRPTDMVVVRFFSKWPWINLIAGRGV